MSWAMILKPCDSFELTKTNKERCCCCCCCMNILCVYELVWIERAARLVKVETVATKLQTWDQISDKITLDLFFSFQTQKFFFSRYNYNYKLAILLFLYTMCNFTLFLCSYNLPLNHRIQVHDTHTISL